MRHARCVRGDGYNAKHPTHTDPQKEGLPMRTPNDYLRALLIELAETAGLSDSAVARAHNRAYPESTLAPSTVQRFRKGPSGEPPSALMEEAYAAATKTSRAANWDEAIRRWRTAGKA